MLQAFLRFTGLTSPPRAKVETAAERHDRIAAYERHRIAQMKAAYAKRPEQTGELVEAREWAYAARGVAVAVKAIKNESMRFRERLGDRDRVGAPVVEYLRACAYAESYVQIVTDEHHDAGVYLRSYRTDLERRCNEDVETWVQALAVEREDTRHATRMGLPLPVPLTVPEPVRREIEKRATEKARLAARLRGGSASGGEKPTPTPPQPPKGPKRS